ncbi:MAG: hypothetical protein NTY14_07715, partial [Candidatus Omnitrophica bacterium]|nr:hypothetical protein [Candidatus Omnitrophota bacterium]
NSYQKSEKPCLNLVFCPRNYQKNSDFSDDLEKIGEKLKKILPFSEFTDKINLYKINITQEEENKFFKDTQDFPPMVVRQDLLENIGNFLKKSPYKLVIIDAKGGVSCAELSEVPKVSLVILGRSRYKAGDSFTKGFLHELGHSLGLRDECVNCFQVGEPGFPNCARTKEDALKYWGDLSAKGEGANFFGGCCGNRNYIRGTIASLMNDAEKAESFGPINERYLKNVLSGAD